MATVGLKGLSK